MMRASLVVLCLLLFAMSAPAEIARAQTAQEVNIERKLRDFEQLVDTRLAGNRARARKLSEQSEQAVRVGAEKDSSPRPECKEPSRPVDIDVLQAELKSALETFVPRLKEDERAYEDGLREYDRYAPSDSRKSEMYFALRLQRLNLAQLRSKGRNIVAIAESYRDTMPDAVASVTTAACFIRDRPGASNSESLSASLISLINDYRELLYIVQR